MNESDLGRVWKGFASTLDQAWWKYTYVLALEFRVTPNSR